MRAVFSIKVAGLAWLLGAPCLGLAHHSPTNYDLGQVMEIEGEITRVLWRNPHVRFWVMHAEESGEETLWEVQATPVVHLMREGITRELFSVGDTIRVAGAPALRSVNEMHAYSVLLSGNREYVLDAGAEPRWSDDAIRRTHNLPPSADPTLGIFRVWSGQGGFSEERYTLTDAARAVAEEMARMPWDTVLDGCTPKGMPEIMAQPNPIEFARQGDDILLRLEEYDTVRNISMGSESAAGERAPTLLGNSIGEWHGDTLVITTTGIDYPWFRQSGIPQSEALEVIERYTVNDEGSMLEMELTATDPATFIGPAVLTKSWTWRPGMEVLPYQCAEE